MSLLAGEPWEEKRFEKWTRKEVDKILHDSPWARPARLRGIDISGGNLYVRWASARTIQQALVRRGLLMGTMSTTKTEPILAEPEPEHLIVLFGRDVRIAAFKTLTEDGVRKDAYLELSRTKERIPASEVEIIRDGTMPMGIAFRFPRQLGQQPSIPADESRVKFFCQLAEAYVSIQFDLRKMVRDGKPDL
ncbi:MAG: hypothetical protein ACRD4U_05505 [Candidatus Acidiferrales bacterium]